MRESAVHALFQERVISSNFFRRARVIGSNTDKVSSLERWNVTVQDQSLPRPGGHGFISFLIGYQCHKLSIWSVSQQPD